jgi:hypothetical protein
MVINHVLSLGANCHVAMYFRMKGYRKFAGPFDWLAADNVAIMDELLATDFADFLDPSLLIEHATGDQHRCGHTKYGSRFFHHYNPRKPDAAAYYQRCVERMRHLPMCAPATVLCFLMIHEEPPEGMLERIHANLWRTFGKTLEFTACIVASDKPARTLTVERCASTFALWRMSLTSHTMGTGFTNQNDNAFFNAAIHTHYRFEIAPAPFDDADRKYEVSAGFDI